LLLDYGCGNGDLLESAAKLGWQIAGVDFDPKVTERVGKRLGAKVVTNVQELGRDFRKDFCIRFFASAKSRDGCSSPSMANVDRTELE